MKYIYFDCYAGFDVKMALGSLIDMSKDTESAKKAAIAITPDAGLFTEEVKRQSMEATLAYFEFGFPEERNPADVLDNLCFDDDVKTKLKLWFRLKSDGKKYSNSEQIKEMVYCAACLNIIKNLGVKDIFVSCVYQGKGVITSENNITVIPSPHTELLAKMASIHTAPANIEKEILTPGGIMLLYVLGAKYMSPKAHNVLKSGYGAGEENLNIPNITRCILAQDGEDELNLNLEAVFSEMNTEFASFAKNE